MDNRLVCYSCICLVSGCISLFVLSNFFYSRYHKISIQSRCRLIALLIEHVYCILMLYWLNKIIAALDALTQWVLILTGGMSLISTVAYLISWIKSRNTNKQLLLVQLDLGLPDRVALNLWNHLFVELWIYSLMIFFALITVGLAVTIKDCQEKKKRERAIRELLVKQKFDQNLYPNQRSCCICLTDYQDQQEITKIPCEHIFHGQCLLGWMEDNSSCPLCRASILEGLDRSRVSRISGQH